MKKRLDIMMVEQGLAPSREKAKAYIMAGEVYVNGQKEDKAGSMFAETVKLEVRGKTLPYVSRGGLKLEKAMKNFGVTLKYKAVSYTHLRKRTHEKCLFCRSGKPLCQKYVYPGLLSPESLCKGRGIQL